MHRCSHENPPTPLNGPLPSSQRRGERQSGQPRGQRSSAGCKPSSVNTAQAGHRVPLDPSTRTHMYRLKLHLATFGLVLALPLLSGCQPKPEAKPEVLLSKPIRLDIPDQEVVLEFVASPENVIGFQSYIIAIEIDNSIKKPNPFHSDTPPPELYVKAEKNIDGQWQAIDTPDPYVSRSRLPETYTPFYAKLPAWHNQEAFSNHLDPNSWGSANIRTILGNFPEAEWIEDGRYRINGHYRVTIKTKQERPDFEGMPSEVSIRQQYINGK